MEGRITTHVLLALIGVVASRVLKLPVLIALLVIPLSIGGCAGSPWGKWNRLKVSDELAIFDGADPQQDLARLVSDPDPRVRWIRDDDEVGFNEYESHFIKNFTILQAIFLGGTNFDQTIFALAEDRSEAYVLLGSIENLNTVYANESISIPNAADATDLATESFVLTQGTWPLFLLESRDDIRKIERPCKRLASLIKADVAPFKMTWHEEEQSYMGEAILLDGYTLIRRAVWVSRDAAVRLEDEVLVKNVYKNGSIYIDRRYYEYPD
jgi:hypothetical protein